MRNVIVVLAALVVVLAGVFAVGEVMAGDPPDDGAGDEKGTKAHCDEYDPLCYHTPTPTPPPPPDPCDEDPFAMGCGPPPPPPNTPVPPPPPNTPVPTPVVPPTPVNTPVVPPTPVNTPVVPPTPVNTPVVPATPVNTPVAPPTPVNTPIPPVVPPVNTPVNTPIPPVVPPVVPPTPVPTPAPLTCSQGNLGTLGLGTTLIAVTTWERPCRRFLFNISNTGLENKAHIVVHVESGGLLALVNLYRTDAAGNQVSTLGTSIVDTEGGNALNAQIARNLGRGFYEAEARVPTFSFPSNVLTLTIRREGVGPPR